MKNGEKKSAGVRSPVTVGAVQVVQGLAKEKAKVAVADLDRLIGLEEFLRENEKKAGVIKVIFNWTDYGHGNRKRVMTLGAVEFIRRFLLHVLPPGFMHI